MPALQPAHAVFGGGKGMGVGVWSPSLQRLRTRRPTWRRLRLEGLPRAPDPTLPPANAANGRTVRSLAYVLSMYKGVKLYFVSPDVVRGDAQRAQRAARPRGTGMPCAAHASVPCGIGGTEARLLVSKTPLLILTTTAL